MKGMTAKPRRATYRHGNLKSAALKAATRLVAAAGHEQLSLREVAEAVGVAHRSLYNHFADREALLDAVATEAYTRLAAILVKAERRRTTPRNMSVSRWPIARSTP